jgi:hypothetical protein
MIVDVKGAKVRKKQLLEAEMKARRAGTLKAKREGFLAPIEKAERPKKGRKKTLANAPK